eukprot:768672-Hanusia_phi.AAC.7
MLTELLSRAINELKVMLGNDNLASSDTRRTSPSMSLQLSNPGASATTRGLTPLERPGGLRRMNEKTKSTSCRASWETPGDNLTVSRPMERFQLAADSKRLEGCSSKMSPSGVCDDVRLLMWMRVPGLSAKVERRVTVRTLKTLGTSQF